VGGAKEWVMLKISGHSDDIVEANIELERKCPCCGAEVEKPTKAVVGGKGDEINAYEQKVWFTIGDEKGGLVVMMFYGSSGCWATSIGQIGEDVPIPWEVRVGAEGHSVVVCVDCPDGTPAKVTRESTS